MDRVAVGALLLAGSMGGLLVILPAAGGTVAPFSLVPALFSAGLGMGLAASSLLGAVLASALYLVHTQYQSRRLYTELEGARAEGRRLEIDNDRLQVEKRAQATPLRVETIARTQLQMRAATPAITHYIAEPAATAATSPPAATSVVAADAVRNSSSGGSIGAASPGATPP